jgi:hypothetical protein
MILAPLERKKQLLEVKYNICTTFAIKISLRQHCGILTLDSSTCAFCYTCLTPYSLPACQGVINYFHTADRVKPTKIGYNNNNKGIASYP